MLLERSITKSKFAGSGSASTLTPPQSSPPAPPLPLLEFDVSLELKSTRPVLLPGSPELAPPSPFDPPVPSRSLVPPPPPQA
jgi:hypothetical protein